MEEKNNKILSRYPYNLLTDYFLETSLKNQPKEYEIASIPARELIMPERIDLMAKWFYIECKMKHMNMQDAQELYLCHIEAFSNGTFVEEGTMEKNSIQKYFKDFDALIEDIRINGFDEKKSLVPIGDGNVLLDGSHRCVCAAYFNKNIRVIKFKNLERNYNYLFFRERLLDDIYLDKMIHQYCKIMKNIYLACIWPKGEGFENRKHSLEIIKGICGKIIYHRTIKLNYRGIYNLMIQAYGHQEWVGNHENKHVGVKEKADNCFQKSGSLLIVFFECDEYKNVLLAKEKIRDIYKIGNHSIHITDNTEETRYLAELLLNSNSIHHMKYGNPDFNRETNLRILELENYMTIKNLSFENIVVSNRGILEIYGLNKTKELDIVTISPEINFNDLEKINNNQKEIKYIKVNKNDMLFNTNNYFVYNGIKFLSLKCLKEMKKNKNNIKDICDIIKINFYQLRQGINQDYIKKIENKYFRYRRGHPSKIKALSKNILVKLLRIFN